MALQKKTISCEESMEITNPKTDPAGKGISVPKIMTFEKTLTVILAKDEEQYCAYCPELDLVTEMETSEEALEDIVEAMKDYAEEYMNEIQLYSNSPNRAHHLPYVKAVASCKSEWDIKDAHRGQI